MGFLKQGSERGLLEVVATEDRWRELTGGTDGAISEGRTDAWVKWFCRGCNKHFEDWESGHLYDEACPDCLARQGKAAGSGVKPRPGRPRVRERKTAVALYMPLSTLEAIEDAADAAGMSVSAWMVKAAEERLFG